MDKSRIQTLFKLNGFTLRHEAAKHLEVLLRPLEDENEAEEWINKIIEETKKKNNLESAVITKDLLIRIVKECSREEAGEIEDKIFNLIDAFDVPRFAYDQERKKFLLDSVIGKREAQIYPDADAKADLFRMRHQMLLQRTTRHDLFTPSIANSGAAGAAGSTHASKTFKLKSVEFLLGTSTKQSDLLILGMLTQFEHGKYSLEDPSGSVHLDLTEAKFHTGLYTENSFVLVEGWYEDNLFHVTAMGFPPSESAETTRAYFGNINFFGGPLETCAKSSTQLQQIEKDNSDSMFVFLSDVWLDDAKVMEKLSKLFAGYSAMPPTCFVLMGNFLSNPYSGSGQVRVLKEHLKSLADIICEYPDLLEHSKFVFVPGPNDPGFTNIYPRPALPKFITEDFTARVHSAKFVSNPCRLQYCTQEIVLFREDIVTKMCRNSIYFPESGDIPSHFGKSLASQGHLAPLPLHVCPVYWDFDRSLYLYPLPDMVVIGDKFDPFATEVQKCTFMNPGSFSKNDFCFKTYIPKTREVEDSQVPDS